MAEAEVEAIPEQPSGAEDAAETHPTDAGSTERPDAEQPPKTSTE
jgi:hypothetical protein